MMFLKCIILKEGTAMPLFLFSLILCLCQGQGISSSIPRFCEKMSRACSADGIWEQKKITVTNNQISLCIKVIFFPWNQKGIFKGKWNLDLAVTGKPIHVAMAATCGTALCAALFHDNEGSERSTKAFLPFRKQSMANWCNMVGIVIGIWEIGHLFLTNMIDDLSIFFSFLKCRFLPPEEITLYFSIQMKNVRMSDCALFICFSLCSLFLTGKYMVLLFAYRETEKS